mmetsp:Transcript_26793/g.72334  ORF Transcript_26793/g.72334 Transcript_26793/m.72334 type:complete len:207 (-) Transcript_26793:2926-3546(-)
MVRGPAHDSWILKNLESVQFTSSVRTWCSSMPAMTRLVKPTLRSRGTLSLSLLPLSISKTLSAVGSLLTTLVASRFLRLSTALLRRVRFHSYRASCAEMEPASILLWMADSCLSTVDCRERWASTWRSARPRMELSASVERWATSRDRLCLPKISSSRASTRSCPELMICRTSLMMASTGLSLARSEASWLEMSTWLVRELMSLVI